MSRAVRRITIPKLARILAFRAGEALPELAVVKAKLCTVAERENAESERQFMHVNCRDDVICYARAAERLEPGYRVGLLVHELGHLGMLAFGLDGEEGREDHSEDDANAMGTILTEIEVGWVAWGDPEMENPFLEWSDIPVDLTREIADQGCCLS